MRFQVSRASSLLATVATTVVIAACAGDRPRLARGAAAPDFSLPGIDGKQHSLRDYADSRVLAVVFTGNSCPASQLYEARLRALADDYRERGVTLVAINPNSPGALQPQDLSFSDVGESLDDMKTRAAHRRISYPYLSDGESQAVARSFSSSIRSARSSTRDGLTTVSRKTPSSPATRGTLSMRCSPARLRRWSAHASAAAR
jgi:thiol-disulfide isomerase/thioredoxin